MYVISKTEKGRNQQYEIENALLEYMQTRLFEDITVVDLCEKACVTRRIFYRHYSNKLGTLQALLDHRVGEFVKAQEKFDRIRLVAVLGFMKEQDELLSAIIKNGFSELFLERLLVYVLENEHLKMKLGYHDIKDGYSVLYFNLSGLMGLVINWHRNGYDKSIEELAELIVRLMAKPITK
jgi:AcrR family transcriptional regulator